MTAEKFTRYYLYEAAIQYGKRKNKVECLYYLLRERAMGRIYHAMGHAGISNRYSEGLFICLKRDKKNKALLELKLGQKELFLSMFSKTENELDFLKGTMISLDLDYYSLIRQKEPVSAISLGELEVFTKRPETPAPVYLTESKTLREFLATQDLFWLTKTLPA